MKKSFAQILSDEERLERAKIASKLPQWASYDLDYPSALCLEQCSSEQTALHKASLIPGGLRVADLTGGLGVDSWAFGRSAEALFYNERNTLLMEAARENFRKLGVGNAEFHCHDIGTDSEPWKEDLKAFGPDWIFLDPARRDREGRKVFRPEDCQPDIVALLPTLLELAPALMVKLSPMADISVLCSAFWPHLRLLEIVGGQGAEVKELLCILNRSESMEEPLVRVISGAEEVFSFRRSEEDMATMSLAEGIEGVLYEPYPSLLKAGAFKLYCDRFELGKIAPSTHLYIGGQTLGADAPFKRFGIIESMPMSGTTLRETGRKYPHAEVTARNIPLRSDELRSRMKITPGDSEGIHIFGCSAGDGGKVLIVTKKFVNTK